MAKAVATDTPEHEHTTRVTSAGFVICVCGWATASPDREPERAATQHIASHCPPDSFPAWVDRAGGSVCIPISGGRSNGDEPDADVRTDAGDGNKSNGD